MNFLRKLTRLVAGVLPFVVLSSLVIYPIYKHLYGGLALVAMGAAAVSVPRIWAPQLRDLGLKASRIPARTWLVSLTIAGLIDRIPLIVFAPNPESDFLIYLQNAQRLAAGLGFGNYLFYPPGQGAFLAVWVKLFGSDLHLLATVETLVSLATISITYAGFSRYSRSAAMWASAVVAIYPSIVIWSGTLGHETLVMFLSAILFWLLGEASERMTVLWWVLYGATSGVLSLVRPTFVVAPILMFACLCLSKHSLSRSALAGAVIMLSCLAAIAPWTWRNYEHFHKFVLISTNFGVTLLSSNHANSDGIWMETMEIGDDLDPASQDKLQMRMALESIAANPSLFAIRTFKRIVYMWGGETSIPDAALGDEAGSNLRVRLSLRALVQISWSVFVAACCGGALRLRLAWDALEAPAVWALLWAGFIFCIHAVLEPAGRHHMALIPMLSGIYLPWYGAWLTGSTDSVLP